MSENVSNLPAHNSRHPARAVKVPLGDGREVWAQWQRANSTNNVTMLINFVVDSGEFQGMTLPWFATYTENTADRIIESLGYMGMQGDNVAQLENENLGELVQVVIERKWKERKDRDGNLTGEKFEVAQVAFVNRNGSGVATFSNPMDERDIAGFAAGLRGSIRGQRAGRAGAQQSPPAGRPAAPAGNGGNRTAAAPQRGYGGGSSHPNAPGSNYGPDDDIPFLTADLSAEPDPRSIWTRWP